MPHRLVFSPPGDGVRLNTVDSTATVKIAATDTEDVYELFEVVVPKGPGVPPHRHPWGEAYYVVAGTLEVTLGTRTYWLEPGASVTIPPNAVHTLQSRTDECRFLAFSLTPGTGRLFADLDRSVPADRPIEEVVPVVLEVARRNGVEFLDAPAA